MIRNIAVLIDSYNCVEIANIPITDSCMAESRIYGLSKLSHVCSTISTPLIISYDFLNFYLDPLGVVEMKTCKASEVVKY